MSDLLSAKELPPTPLGRSSTEEHAKAAWRTFRPIIELSKCTKCNLCWKFCPDIAIQFDADGWPHIRYEFCKGCTICATVCAPEAITMEREG